MLLHPNITIRREREKARAVKPTFTIYSDTDPDVNVVLHPNITVRTRTPASICFSDMDLHPNITIRTKKQHISSIGQSIIDILKTNDVSKLYSYIRSTRLFEDCKNNVKLMSILKDEYYHIPLDVWFPITGISMSTWKELTENMKNATVLWEEMNPHIYILKPDTEIRTQVFKPPFM
jgi:hypothetical protein